MSHLSKGLENCKLELTNRLVFPPMATAKSDNGMVSKEMLDYYDEKSKGGYFSLIIIEHSYIAPQGKASKGQLSIAEDCNMEGLKKLAEVIHKNGSKAIMQINHAGSAAKMEVTGYENVSPSAIINPLIKSDLPKELTKEEIKEIIEYFKVAAKRVKEAGFDGVEIHSAHSYLLDQFYSPITNKRTDEYGGDVLGRIKIHLEVINAVKEAVGNDFPILLRLGACDYKEGGTTIEDSKIAAVEFQKAGIEILDISGGLCGYMVPDKVNEQGYFSEITEAIKEVASMPVILTGGITEPEAAEELVASGKTDLVGIGRAAFKDSMWAKNAIESLK
ncbi:2,4-dienoyl-CoA reductase-like NADH-dependent reductase (Old Yellow Enzyme family) [Clostridium saccharoperbutylacetonicum]|uniref:NADH-flavin oxidoreductase, Old yellow enzyme family n=1 Tax=Clostridium saccharoperbutylacetonicum N1-4(HMT) TaxID=931276 RepID=M1LSR5_9CLOT|nr:NADH:flavin oxidoreductase [Clostridium saccharoperbutylacetonicum]AGF56045.1 NADH-flavin oxidoreductase, Old yellow enzyme family [Clostridium saccharoperbutylacetonicum N1-4(HMT)]NRT63216.1 2,4-dienoyl-CoA reductase-like NADH-dependent reductase (Old Yellow Enzyme family) [Clostridium saccharoperbutylacetonicum]NSB26576.1 2,4-dienoyl-CoA reductase-like NADH-dependent reductase (Old Yellow Enzyme family) [Clostridium saccharoperbutylacetonicum]NSB45927.1 2,4-dienoyl-CoA reductase-like NADH-